MVLFCLQLLIRKSYSEEDQHINKNPEFYASHIAAQFSKMTQKRSFMVWGKSSVINQQDCDPNYLLPKMFSKSPFHQSLHYWTNRNIEKPLLHIDVHGKLDLKNNCEIEVGIESMIIHWQNSSLPMLIKEYFQKQMNYIFQGYKFGGHQCKFVTDCDMHGYWGEGMCSMSQQAVILGIPSIQLQISRKVRQKLFKDGQLMKKFSLGINRLYEKVIIPRRNKTNRKLKIQNNLILKYMPSLKNEKQYLQSLGQIRQFEKKEQLNLNLKFV